MNTAVQLRMNSEQALEAANIAMLAYFDRQLSDVETAILRGAWQNQTYEQIAEEAGYSVRYIKGDVGAKFWKLLSQALGETVSKTNFRAALERQWSQNNSAGKKRERAQNDCQETIVPPLPQSHFTFVPQPLEAEASLSCLPTVPLSSISVTPPRCDWGDAIDISLFCGRTEEQALLNQWIMGDRCRLVALLGIGGIGKTALSVKVGRNLVAPNDRANLETALPSRNFSHVIWRSLRNAPPLEMLLGDLIFFLSDQQDTEIRLSRLMHWLRCSRCLIILDNVETILQAGDRAGRYRSGYENYGELLRMIGETQHQSCLMLTSREKPAEIATLEGTELAVRSLSLTGSAETAEAVLQANQLMGSSKQKQRLCRLYGYNPLALKMISTSIHELFDGDISGFLAEKTIAFNGIRKLLDQQFNRLSALEQTIMYWLAINREWTSIADLAEDIFPAVTRSDLLEALESLRWRSLIKKLSATEIGKSSHYTQQPVVMEYVTNRLVEQIYREIREWQTTNQGEVNSTEKTISRFSLRLFQTHALLKTNIKDYLRHAQRKLIVEPITSKMRDRFGSEQAIEQRLQQILHSLHQGHTNASGYAAGNLINLYQCLQIDLTGYDFSHLNIWYADLQAAKLHHVNFAHANLSKSVFLQTFGFGLSVALSPDDRLLATGDSNGQVHLWQMEDGQPLSLLQDGDTGWVWSVAFSPDGQQLASGSVEQTIKIWDVQTQQLVRTLHGHSNWVRSVAFDPMGQRLASGSTDRTVRIWDRQTWDCLQVLDEKEDAVWSVAWHPTENWLATANNNGTLKLWNVTTGTYLQIFQGHTAWVRSVSWNPDGTILASGSDDGTVKLWDPQTGKCLQTFSGHTNAVWDVVWNSDGQQFASVSHDKTVRIWDISNRHCLKILNDHKNWIWGAVWSANRQTLITTAHDTTIRLWDTQAWNCLRTIQGYTSVAMHITWSPDGKTLAGSCDDQVVRLWNVETEQCNHCLKGHTNVVWSVAWNPNGHILASSGDDRTVRLWELESGKCLKILQHSHWVWTVAWHPHGALLATGTQDYEVKVWDVSTGICLRTLQGHRNSIWCVAWHPEGNLLAGGCDDGTVRVWNPQTGECVFVLSHRSSVRKIAWSPDGKYLATSSADAIARIWDRQTGECIVLLQGHTNSIWDVSWSFNGQILASGGDDQTVRLWDVQTGKCLSILQGHTSQIWSIAWHPHELMLASSSADKTVKVWDAQRGKCLKTLDTNRPYFGMNIAEVRGLTETQKVTLRALGAVE